MSNRPAFDSQNDTYGTGGRQRCPIIGGFARSSTWAASHLYLSSAQFITIIAESNFRYRQVARSLQVLAYKDLTRLHKIPDGLCLVRDVPRALGAYLPLGSGCALKTSRVSCLVITLSSCSAPASLSRSIIAISGRMCSWVSSRSCSGVCAGTERAVAERRRLVMIRPSLLAETR